MTSSMLKHFLPVIMQSPCSGEATYLIQTKRPPLGRAFVSLSSIYSFRHPQPSFSGSAGFQDQRALLNTMSGLEPGVTAARRKRITVQLKFVIACVDKRIVV